MQKYCVNMTRVENGTVELEAFNKYQAIEEAKELEKEGDVQWTNTEVEIGEVELIKTVDPPDRTGAF